MKRRFRRAKTILAVLIAFLFGSILLPINALATGISFAAGAWDEKLPAKKGTLPLLSYNEGEFGPFYVKADLNGKIKSVQNSEYWLRYVGEDGDFYKGLDFSDMSLIYIPKDKARVFSEMISYPYRKAGTYRFADPGKPEKYESKQEGDVVTSILVDPGTPGDVYVSNKHLSARIYYAIPDKGKTATIIIKGSKKKSDDGTFKIKKGATITLDGTETVTIKNGIIVSFYLAPTNTINKIVQKYPERFKVTKPIENWLNDVPEGEEIAFTDDALEISFE